MNIVFGMQLVASNPYFEAQAAVALLGFKAATAIFISKDGLFFACEGTLFGGLLWSKVLGSPLKPRSVSLYALITHSTYAALQVAVRAQLDVLSLRNTSFEASLSLGMGAQESVASQLQSNVANATQQENSALLQTVNDNNQVAPLCSVAFYRVWLSLARLGLGLGMRSCQLWTTVNRCQRRSRMQPTRTPYAGPHVAVCKSAL